eukprot:gene7140-7355_t
MFEAQVVGLLQHYLGRYVYGLDAESLRISVWRGDVELRNLRLKPEALEELNLPITVKSGLLGRLTLKVPWAKLGQEPVVAEFDRLYVVACPRQDDSSEQASPDSADGSGDHAAAIERKAKEQRVSKAEDAWLKDVAAKDSTSGSAAETAASSGAGAVGRLRALVDTIIGNLELHITNIHIRYEDPSSNPGHTFCIGIVLQEISAHTVDDAWRRAFVKADALLTMRKGVQLRGLAIYFDCDEHLTDICDLIAGPQQQNKQGGDEAIAKLDAQLDESVILLFRRMAHVKFKAMQKATAAASAAEAAGKQQKQQQGWVGWLMGTSAQRPSHQAAKQATAAAAVATAAGAGGPDVDMTLGPEEWNKLEDLVTEQAAALGEDQKDTPYTVKAIMQLQVVVAALELQDTSGNLLLQAAMGGVDSKVVSYPQTMDVAFCVAKNPQDNSADVLVRLAVAPSYVTYNNAAMQAIANFFKSEDTMELSTLQAQAAARTDKLRQAAQLQLRSLSQRSAAQKPRMKLFLTLHAPKIAVADAAEAVTLIADLGCFTITTNPAAVKSMSPDEVAIYEAFVVKVDHVSAYLLDGPFAWPSNEEARVVPLLDRFGLGMDVQVATSVHPRYPVMRLAISASPLKLHLSPYRYQQLMMVVHSVLATSTPTADTAGPGSRPGAAAGAAASDGGPLWLSEAEYTAKVSQLAWEGLTSRTAKWQSHRYVHVWRGRTYITSHRNDTDVNLSKTYWMSYRVVVVPPAAVGGCDNVIAIVPSHVKPDAAAESPDSLVLRAPDAATAKELRKKLVASASQMAAVAGLLELGADDQQDAAIGTTKDVFDELFSHQQLLQLYGSITEVSVTISGRAPVNWWPPGHLPSSGSLSVIIPPQPPAGSGSTAAAPAGGTPATDSSDPADEKSAPGAGPAAHPAAVAGQEQVQQDPAQPAISSAPAAAVSALSSVIDSHQHASLEAARGREVSVLVAMQEEVDLVSIKFQGAQVGVSINGDGFTTEVAMAALTMDDLLVGARNPDKAHMARSSIVWDEHQHYHQHQRHSQQILQQLVQQQAPAGQQNQADDGTEVATPAPGTNSSRQTPGSPHGDVPRLSIVTSSSGTPTPQTALVALATDTASAGDAAAYVQKPEGPEAAQTAHEEAPEDDEFYDADESKACGMAWILYR